MNKLSDESVEQIIHLVKKGFSIRLIAAEMHCSKVTVQRYANQLKAEGKPNKFVRNKDEHPDHRKSRMCDYNGDGFAYLAAAVMESAINDYRKKDSRSHQWRSAYNLLNGKAKGPGGRQSMLEFCCALIGSDPDYVKENVLNDIHKRENENSAL